MAKKKPPNDKRLSLERQADPQSIWEQAEAFRYTSRIVLKNLSDDAESNNFGLSAPYVVNVSFSLEIYFKCLHMIVNDKIPGGHKLKDLFRSLPEEERRRITNYFQDSLTPNSVTVILPQKFPELGKNLADVLDHIDDAFRKWRYIYEANPPTFSFYGSHELTLALRKRILELLPGLNPS